MLAELELQGARYVATRGFASFADQDLLHAQGRARPGRPRVTNARGGESAHNFGLAIDFTADSSLSPGLQPDWSTAAYLPLVRAAKQRGLHSGEGYGDLPHVSHPRFIVARDMAPLKEIYNLTPGDEHAKLKAVWAHVGGLK